MRFLKENEEWVLAAAGLLMLGLLAACATWTVTRISIGLGNAISASEAGSGKIEFNLDEARKMNLRGLGGAEAVTPSATTSASSSSS